MKARRSSWISPALHDIRLSVLVMAGLERSGVFAPVPTDPRFAVRFLKEGLLRMSPFRFSTGFRSVRHQGVTRAAQSIALGLMLSAGPLMIPIGEANAQQGGAEPNAPAAAGQAAKPKAKPATAAAPAAGEAAAAAPAGGGDAALKKRVEQLEAQLVDLQVVIGTLESLARSGVRPPAAAPAGEASSGGSADPGRLQTLETQVRALSQQVEQLTAQRRSDAGSPKGAFTADPTAGGVGEGSAKIGQWAPAGGASKLPPVSPADNTASVEGARFGAGPVDAGSLDPIGPQDATGAATGAGAGVGAAPGAAGAQGTQMAAIDAAPLNPKQLYEQAYGYLLQQNYGQAQAGFSEFLKSYPKDGLAPNALYWLGETHYVQKNYADAAEAFDLVTNTYASSIKAPDAQLKRGMSLAQLGKKQEACSAFRDLSTKFPAAPVHIKQKADTERQRNACP